MTEQTLQAFRGFHPSSAQMQINPGSEKQADYLAHIAARAVKLLITDRGTPTTRAEVRKLLRDAAILADMTWTPMPDKD